MKKLIALACLLTLAQIASAQTYENLYLTQFNYAAGVYVASTNIVIPTNVVAKILNLAASDAVNSGSINVQYAGQPIITSSDPSQWVNWPLMGPCTVTISAASTSASGNFAVALAQFQTVNTTPNLQGYAVQPNGKTATVAMESSTNLINWASATNGTYSATNRAQFYRLKMSVN